MLLGDVAKCPSNIEEEEVLVAGIPGKGNCTSKGLGHQVECSHVGRTNGSTKGEAVKIRVGSDGGGFYAKSLGFITKAVELIKGFKTRAVGKALQQLRWVEVRKGRREQEEQMIATFQGTENMMLPQGKPPRRWRGALRGRIDKT